MILPPAILRLRLRNDERRIRLWIPLVLLWPVVAAALLLGMPLAVLAAAFSWHRGWGRPILLAGPLLLYLLASLRGLRLDLASGDGRLFLSFD